MKKVTRSLLILLVLILANEIAFAQAPQWLWGKNGRGYATEEGANVATDATGNVYATGDMSSDTLIFGNDTLFKTGLVDFFIVKYAPDGAVQWAHNAGGTGGVDDGTDITVDKAGNIYVIGFFTSATITFGTYTLTDAASTGSFLTKYDPSGNVLWAVDNTISGDDRPRSVATDSAGNVYTTGNGNNGIYIRKYNEAGGVVWTDSAIATIYDAFAIGTDKWGNSYITGSFRGDSIIFGPDTLHDPTGTRNIYLAKYDSSGNLNWARSVGAPSYAEAYGLATDVAGNFYLTGYFSSPTLALGTYTLTGTGAETMFIAKYDSSGTVLWARSGTSTGNVMGYNVSPDTSGNVYLSGGFTSTVNFGSVSFDPPPGTCAAACDPLFIVKYDPSGNIICVSGLSSGGDDYSDVATDNFGNVYIGADFTASPFIIGSDTMTLANPHGAVASENIVIAKYRCGTPVEIKTPEPATHYTSVLPNPFSDQAVLHTDVSLNDATLTVYNTLGKAVKQINNITGQTVTLSREGLSNGIYLVRITENGQTITTEKVVVGSYR